MGLAPNSGTGPLAWPAAIPMTSVFDRLGCMQVGNGWGHAAGILDSRNVEVLKAVAGMTAFQKGLSHVTAPGHRELPHSNRARSGTKRRRVAMSRIESHHNCFGSSQTHRAHQVKGKPWPALMWRMTKVPNPRTCKVLDGEWLVHAYVSLTHRKGFQIMHRHKVDAQASDVHACVSVSSATPPNTLPAQGQGWW